MDKKVIKISESTLKEIVNESVRRVLNDYEHRSEDSQEALKESVLHELLVYLTDMIEDGPFTFPNVDNNTTITTRLFWEQNELNAIKQMISITQSLLNK